MSSKTPELASRKIESVTPDDDATTGAIVPACAGPTTVITQIGADHVTPLDEQTENKLHHAMNWLWESAKGR